MASEGARAGRTTLCPQGFYVEAQPHSQLSIRANTNFKFSGPVFTVAQNLLVPRGGVGWGHSHSTLEGALLHLSRSFDPAGPHFLNCLSENPTVLPELWAAGSVLGLGPSPSYLRAAAYHPWADGTQWPDCRKSEDWGQFPSLPGLATVPVGQTCNHYLTHKFWPIVLMTHCAVC